MHKVLTHRGLRDAQAHRRVPIIGVNTFRNPHGETVPEHIEPELFRALRPEIDADRRPGRFLLLGSASGELLRQKSESLAGRISYLELPPVLAAEMPSDLATLQQLWRRGGFPLSLLAVGDAASFEWRRDFIASFLLRDLAQMGVQVASESLHRFWRMLAHLQGQQFNASMLGESLGGVAHTTVKRYADTLVDALMLRRLEPHLVNVGKRLVKSPKVYVRDSGLLHALLGIQNLDMLQGHPIVGTSWEGFVIEQIAAALPSGSQLGFYRTAAGTGWMSSSATARAPSVSRSSSLLRRPSRKASGLPSTT